MLVSSKAVVDLDMSELDTTVACLEVPPLIAFELTPYISVYFDVPAKADATAAQLVILIKAQSEMTYYILMHLEDEDRRKGIQAQGVVSAGIVKEAYDKDKSSEVPIPPIVKTMLVDYYKFTAPFYSVDIDRDENEAVSEDVTDF